MSHWQFWTALSGSINVRPVLEPEDRDHRLLVVDLVDHAIRTTPRRPQTREFSLQWMANTSGVLAQWAEHELDHRRSDTLGQPSKLSFC